MDILLILVGLALLLVLLTMLTVTLYFAYTQVRRKGYSPPAAAMTLALAACAGVAVGAYWIAAFPAQLTNLQIFVYAFYLPMLATAGVAASAMVLLPTRAARTFGERRPGFPFERVGRAVMGLGILAAAAAIVASLTHHLASQQLSRALNLVAGFVIPTGLYFVYLARRTQAPSLPTVLERDARAVALYLRAFNQESQFVWTDSVRLWGFRSGAPPGSSKEGL